MNLLCLSDFNQDGYIATAGDVCWFPHMIALRMLDAWPGCWEKAPHVPDAPAVETEAIEAPPADKMMRKAKAKRRG